MPLYSEADKEESLAFERRNIEKTGKPAAYKTSKWNRRHLQRFEAKRDSYTRAAIQDQLETMKRSSVASAAEELVENWFTANRNKVNPSVMNLHVRKSRTNFKSMKSLSVPRYQRSGMKMISATMMAPVIGLLIQTTRIKTFLTLKRNSKTQTQLRNPSTVSWR